MTLQSGWRRDEVAGAVWGGGRVEGLVSRAGLDALELGHGGKLEADGALKGANALGFEVGEAGPEQDDEGLYEHFGKDVEAPVGGGALNIDDLDGAAGGGRPGGRGVELERLWVSSLRT